MSELSPAARAVDRAVADRIQLLGEIAPSLQIAAAALRAAADQVVPLYICGTNATRAQTRLGIRHKLLALAAELEGQ